MAGVCILGDKARVIADTHGCPACPHPCIGPATAGSGDVLINGKPALRMGDTGIHAACCGPNTWECIEASAGVVVNGQPLVRKGDKTLHCGATLGEMIEASGDVSDGSGKTKIKGDYDLIGGSLDPFAYGAGPEGFSFGPSVELHTLQFGVEGKLPLGACLPYAGCGIYKAPVRAQVQGRPPTPGPA